MFSLARRGLEKAKDNEDLNEIKSKTEALVQSSMKLGEEMYKQNSQASDSAPQPDSSGEEPSSKKDEGDKVVDADFEEVDDSKKN